MKQLISKRLVILFVPVLTMMLGISSALADDEKDKDEKSDKGQVQMVGPAGPQGPIGLTGPAGTNGAVGPQGPVGLTGSVGPAGVAGPTGPTGPAGTNAWSGGVGQSVTMDSVGIGTSTPTEKLEVIGNIHATGTIRSGNSIFIDGITDVITATSGTIGFDNENLITTGQITATSFIGDGSGLTNIPAGPQGPQGSLGPAGPQGPPGLVGQQGSVPTGLMVLSSSSIAPVGFTFTGMSVNTNTNPSTGLSPWTAKAQDPCFGSGGGVISGKIYSSNGNNMCVYDPVSDIWLQKAASPVLFTIPSVAAAAGKIHVMGGVLVALGGPFGQQPVGADDAHQAYDPVTDTWSAKSPMLTARWGMRTAVLGNKIYTVGGQDTNFQVSNVNEVYDAFTDTWTSAAPITVVGPLITDGVPIGGQIYFFGGGSASYDPVNDIWAAIAPMPNGPSVRVAAAIGGKAYAFGANINIYVYDPAGDSWVDKGVGEAGFPSWAFPFGSKIYLSAQPTLWEYDPGVTTLLYVHIKN